MKIRIISEKKITPLNIGLPTDNQSFTNIHLPEQQHLPPPSGKDVLQVFMQKDVHTSIWQHCHLSGKQELGGALMGFYGIDNGQRFLLICDVLHQPPEYYASPTLLRFTSQFYDDLNEKMEQLNRSYPELLRLGMYHTHPGYGVFLSNTDVETFKGVYKDPWNIAIVIDPLKDDEGVFFWLEGDVSPPSPFKVYDSQNPQYQQHTTTTRNPVLAKYNQHLQLTSGNWITPKLERASEENEHHHGEHNHDHKSHIDLSEMGKPEKVTIDQPPEIAINKIQKEQLKIEKQPFTPKMCPLYNMRYKNHEIKLYRYFKPITTKVELNEFPYYIFLHLSIREALEVMLDEVRTVAGLLKGRFHFDKLKNLYFLDLYGIITEPVPENRSATTFIQEMYEKYMGQGEIDLMGWLFASKNSIGDTYHFFEKHRELFSESHHIGLVIPSHGDEILEFEYMNIIAYNFDINEPFEYYKHFFLYEKPY